MPKITLSEWQRALSVSIQEDEGKTVREISSETGLCLTHAKDKIRKLVQDGFAIRGSATRVNTRGIKYRASVYKLTK